jgi:hypothetical protein
MGRETADMAGMNCHASLLLMVGICFSFNGRERMCATGIDDLRLCSRRGGHLSVTSAIGKNERRCLMHVHIRFSSYMRQPRSTEL